MDKDSVNDLLNINILEVVRFVMNKPVILLREINLVVTTLDMLTLVDIALSERYILDDATFVINDCDKDLRKAGILDVMIFAVSD